MKSLVTAGPLLDATVGIRATQVQGQFMAAPGP